MKENLKTPRPNPEPAPGFSLPELCRVEALFGLILLAELLVLVLVLADPVPGGLDWSRLALTSFFVQWVLLLTVALLCRLRPLLARRSALLISLLTCLVCVAVTLACTWASLLLELYPPDSQLTGLPLYLRHGLISLIMSAIVVRVLYLQGESRRQQQASLQARLQALQARIRPHFLYNSLNSIASLTAIDPDKAEQALLDLSQLFRATLAETGELSSWQAELALTRRYLSLEQYRFGERLRLRWDIDGIPEALPIPHLCLQPLLENAILHGIQPRIDGGLISVSARLQDGSFYLKVSNPLPDIQTTTGGSGTALENIRMRLAVLFGPTARLNVRRQADAFITEIQYPCPKPVADTPAATVSRQASAVAGHPASHLPAKGTCHEHPDSR